MSERIIALRGATTIEANTREEIVSKTTELVRTLAEDNGIGSLSRAVWCMISTTSDITAFYPARSVRESGLLDCPLMSCLEPAIENSLPLCIRVLIELATDEAAELKPCHAYLHGAAALRPDLARPFKTSDENKSDGLVGTYKSDFGKVLNVAIDGPSGAGKSTVAKLLSRRLSMTYLDTGAMYRAIGLKMHRKGIALSDISGIERTLDGTRIEVENIDGVQHVLLDGKDVSGEIRRHYVSKLASDFSAVKQVRLKLVEMQRKIASEKDCILDGRDIGTFVLPNAAVKFYLTASVKVRAKRRFDELTAKGETCELEAIEKDIEARDYNDMHRDFAPLKKADDAVEVVTDDMSVEQVVAFMSEIINSKR